jgi:hypothetical protein
VAAAFGWRAQRGHDHAPDFVLVSGDNPLEVLRYDLTNVAFWAADLEGDLSLSHPRVLPGVAANLDAPGANSRRQPLVPGVA